MEFFTFHALRNNNIMLAERLVPFSILCILVGCLVIFRKKLSKDENSMKKARRILFYLITGIFFTQYILRYSQLGITKDLLPLHLCGLSAIMCIVILRKINLKIIYFLQTVTIPAAFLAIVDPSTNGSWINLEYYLFMAQHFLLIIIPLYFLVVENISPNVKKIFLCIIIFTCLALTWGVINTLWDTNYMFISFKENKVKTGILAALGSAPYYIIPMIGIASCVFSIWGTILTLISKKLNKINR